MRSLDETSERGEETGSRRYARYRVSNHPHAGNPLLPQICLTLIGLSIVWAVISQGGSYMETWKWSGAAVTLASALLVVYNSACGNAPKSDFGMVALFLALGWMIFQLVPLPPGLIAELSPQQWNTVMAARKIVGVDATTWLPLSASASRTVQALLFVVPAMAAFVAMREYGARHGRAMWKAVLAIVLAASLEAALGVMQYSGNDGDSEQARAAGTYLNPDHFAGLLELAFPLCVAWAAARWRHGLKHRTFPSYIVGQIAILSGLSLLLLMGSFASLSRMGQVSILASLSVVLAFLLAPNNNGDRKYKFHSWLRWSIPIALPLFVLILLSPVQAILRFAGPDQLSGNARIGIWRDAWRLIRVYSWTGCGLGAFEEGLYPFRTYAPDFTINYAHNDYLQLIAELGWIGACFVGALAVWVFGKALHASLFRRGERNWELAVGILGSIVALGLHSLTDFNMYEPANALIFASLCGIVVSKSVQQEKAHE